MRTIDARAVLVLIVVLATSCALHAQAAVGTAFTYQAQLKQSGAPVDGATDFKFSLWDAESGGAQIGATLLFDGQPGNSDAVTVNEGLFTVALDFGATAFAGDARWLQIEVRSPHDPGDALPYTILAPRQTLTPAPYSLYATESADLTLPFDRTWAAPGTNVLKVTNTGAGGVALRGVCTAESAHGVMGTNLSSGGGTGVYGTALGAGGMGVRGYASDPDGWAGYFEGRGYFSENVGIGTTAPESPLHIFGFATTTTWSFDNIDGSLYVSTPAGVPGISAFANNGHRRDIRFGDGAISILTSPSEAVPSATNGITVDESGYVGINTTAPKQRLHVGGGYYGAGLLYLHAFQGDGANGTAYVQARDDSGTSSIGMQLRTQDAGTMVNALLLTPAGDVGIGTMTPGAKLDVAGTVKSTGFQMTAGPTAGHVLTCDASGVGTWQAPTGGSSLWSQSGNNIYYNDGNVGIGTDAPAYDLHIYSMDDADLAVKRSGGARIAMVAGTAAGSLQLSNHAFRLLIDSVEKMRVDPSGNVGIGTTSPSTTLDVAGTVKSTGFQMTASPAAGRVLTCDVTGVGTWQAPTGVSGSGSAGYVPKFTAGTTLGNSVLFETGGNIGVGTTAPAGKLTIAGTEDADLLSFATGGADRFSITAHASGGTDSLSIRSKLENPDTEIVRFEADSDIVVPGQGGGDSIVISAMEGAGNGQIEMFNSLSPATKTIQIDGDVDGDNGGWVGVYDNAGNLTIELDGRDGTNLGRVSTQVLEITGGSDLSEQFDISTPAGAPEPGMVVVIDPENPGQLRLATQPYDPKVAGVISGANGIRPGMLMAQRDTAADGQYPVALTGRVWCWCDASYGAIEPGDRLTTSATVGHAMKVTGHDRAPGTVIGKAMTALDNGCGLVLVLVQPQ